MTPSSCLSTHLRYRSICAKSDTIILRNKTPDPIPNSEVKLLRPSVVLPFGGKAGVVLDLWLMISLSPCQDIPNSGYFDADKLIISHYVLL